MSWWGDLMLGAITGDIIISSLKLFIFIGTRDKITCPACGEMKMKFIRSGHWD